jgi:hypothetical protein
MSGRQNEAQQAIINFKEVYNNIRRCGNRSKALQLNVTSQL